MKGTRRYGIHAPQLLRHGTADAGLNQGKIPTIQADLAQFFGLILHANTARTGCRTHAQATRFAATQAFRTMGEATHPFLGVARGVRANGTAVQAAQTVVSVVAFGSS